MPDSTVLCWKTSLATTSGHVTIADYKKWIADGENSKKDIAIFLKERLRERYIDPVEALSSEEKNGFAIMALSCLLIETVESFYQGWPTSPNSSLAFCNFFDRQKLFHHFKGYVQQFYKHVRCGILHQGETTGGWTIKRNAGAPLFAPTTLTIHATLFHKRVSQAVDEYSANLKTGKIGDDLWLKFCKKMNATVKQCGSSTSKSCDVIFGVQAANCL